MQGARMWGHEPHKRRITRPLAQNNEADNRERMEALRANEGATWGGAEARAADTAALGG